MSSSVLGIRGPSELDDAEVQRTQSPPTGDPTQAVPEPAFSEIVPEVEVKQAQGEAPKSDALWNPMREHSPEYVINMWKVYNQVHLGRRNSAQLFNLLAYCGYICIIWYLLSHLPPPAVMLAHQEAVKDLLLGEEFDAQTTHIYKSWFDVMTAEEMWQWAQGPMAAALLVDGAPHGKMDALVGTNWLIGSVRIRQERSVVEAGNESCAQVK